MKKIPYYFLLTLLPLFLLVFFLLQGNDADLASLAISFIWFFLLERKGYPLLGNFLLFLAASLYLYLGDISLAFLLGVALLALPSLLLPGRYQSREIWVLSSGGPGAFQYRFKREE